jgi:hypothetical protein
MIHSQFNDIPFYVLSGNSWSGKVGHQATYRDGGIHKPFVSPHSFCALAESHV